MLDFESEISIELVEIFVEYPIYSYAYKIEISKNGKDWKTVDEKNTKIGSDGIKTKN